MTMATLEEAKQAYSAARLHCGHVLLPPSGEAAIDALAAALSSRRTPQRLQMRNAIRTP
jgi:hypothetical protein